MTHNHGFESSPGHGPDTPDWPAANGSGAPDTGAAEPPKLHISENAIQEIDPALIDGAGVEDRLGQDSEADRILHDSLATYGQQVPILVRPHPDTTGRFEIVYGRRRVVALRALGRPVRAMVRQLDDHALVLAQGQENTARQDLTFIEKASFAAQLHEVGYERQTICDALSIDLPMVSRMLKVGRAFPMQVLRQIGSAPSVGRERWLALARAYADPIVWTRTGHVLDAPEFQAMTSDERFDALFAAATRSPAKRKAPRKAPEKRPLTGPDGTGIGQIQRSASGVRMTISGKAAPGFDAWLDSHAEAVIAELYARWAADRDGNEGSFAPES